MQTLVYQGVKIEATKTSSIKDSLVTEAPLQININNEPYTVVMRTPGNDIELIRGLLFAEDIYKGLENLETELVEEKASYSTIINVKIATENLGKGYLNKRTLLSVSSCGICGKQKLEDLNITGKKLNDSLRFSSEQIPKMFEVLKANQVTFLETGGSHAAGVFNNKHQLLTIQEDIGRHNAVDKCVGSLLQSKKHKEAQFLLVSGRVSFEIVSKAFIAKIPIIIAVSACSSLAVDFAKELGICLIGFTRNQKMTIYSNPNFLIK